MELKKVLFFRSVNEQGIATNISLYQFVCVLVASTMVFSVTAFADGGSRKLPGIDHEIIYKVPENLESMETAEVQSLRSARQKDLDNLRNKNNSKSAAEQTMFEQLMAHDAVRLTITDVIPQLVEEYKIEGKFKKTLMGYRSTFAEEITESRSTVSNLQDYQSYDFRFTAVYMSMLFAFQEYPDFYNQLKIDMTDEKTSIGAYRKRLDDSYHRVEQARQQMDAYHNADDLENVIAALDEELARREK